ncbi:MAG: hypothetical protein SF052_03345 [Bacteroidia bacterium]|nr:hypothetical protein [Bacteroidia bacterium]
MKLYINDANILMDIVQLDIVDSFLSLNAALYTTDFVFAELNQLQQSAMQRQELIRLKPEGEDLVSIFELFTNINGLSIEDCSVLHFAEKMKGCLISGDGKLRKVAKARHIEVRGIIYIMEQIKTQGLLDLVTCVDKLHELKTINERLPMDEIDARIEAWRLEINHPR